jgi:hypothetical protein
MSRGKQRSPEQIVRLIQDAEMRLANGEVVAPRMCVVRSVFRSLRSIAGGNATRV